MTDELKAATDRFRRAQTAKYMRDIYTDCFSPTQELAAYTADEAMCAKAYLADLARREEQDREDAEPATERWQADTFDWRVMSMEHRGFLVRVAQVLGSKMSKRMFLDIAFALDIEPKTSIREGCVTEGE